MKKLTFKEFLVEMPVQDYQTFGNFDKSSSFRHEQDRKMVTSPKAIKNVHKKWGKIPYDFNLYFVNSAKGNRHTEVGAVNAEWVSKNLDPEVAQKIAQQQQAGKLDDAITVIFTNNKGDQRVPITPWMMGHRLAHALRRKNGWSDTQGTYNDAERHLISQVKELMHYYGKKSFVPDKNLETNQRRDQLAMIYLFNHIATFKSAREHKIRDWFEVMNELIAQYIISGGNIKFNPPPRCFGGGSRASRQNYCAKEEEMEDLTNHVEMLGRDMNYMIDQIFSSAVGNIYVM